MPITIFLGQVFTSWFAEKVAGTLISSFSTSITYQAPGKLHSLIVATSYDKFNKNLHD
jgi:uncharacterized membrane protein